MPGLKADSCARPIVVSAGSFRWPLDSTLQSRADDGEQTSRKAEKQQSQPRSLSTICKSVHVAVESFIRHQPVEKVASWHRGIFWIRKGVHSAEHISPTHDKCCPVLWRLCRYFVTDSMRTKASSLSSILPDTVSEGPTLAPDYIELQSLWSNVR